MTSDLSLFSSYAPTFNHLPVHVSSGTPHNVLHIGVIHISPNFILKDVLHIPSFKLNLLSVQKWINTMDCIVTFFPSFCIFQDRASRTVIGSGEARNGIYYLHIPQYPEIYVKNFEARRPCNLTFHDDDCDSDTIDREQDRSKTLLFWVNWFYFCYWKRAYFTFFFFDLPLWHWKRVPLIPSCWSH